MQTGTALSIECVCECTRLFRAKVEDGTGKQRHRSLFPWTRTKARSPDLPLLLVTVTVSTSATMGNTLTQHPILSVHR
jgi:hypothetical protein